jgi:hypothetical protein
VVIRALPLMALCSCAYAAAGGHPDAGGDHESPPPVDASFEAETAPPPPDDAGADVASPDLACGVNTTQDQCLTCCENNHPHASVVMNQALFDCACVPSVCATECAASFCIDKGTDTACVACLQPTLTGACEQPLMSACAADQDCTAWKNCQVPCPSRPP